MTQNDKQKDTRKPYAPPSVTEFGRALDKTKGMWGEGYETFGRVTWDTGDPDNGNGGN